MVGDRYGTGAAVFAALHDEVTAALAYLYESILL